MIIADILSGLILVVVILLFFNALFNPMAVEFCETNGYAFQGKIFQAHQCWKLNEQNEVVIRSFVYYNGTYNFVAEEGINSLSDSKEVQK